MTKTRDLADLGGGFIQAGSGAVQRTVESKLQDVVSVKDFGAVGNGFDDDTPAIQAAINAGNSIYFPDGEYLITSPITVAKRGLKLYADTGVEQSLEPSIVAPGSTGAVILCNFSSGTAFTVTQSQVQIYGLSFYGYSSANSIKGIRFASSSTTGSDNIDAWLDGCTFQNFTTCIEVIGRACTATNNAFVGSNVGILLDWPASGTSSSPTSAVPPLGHRSCRIISNRFHAIANQAILSQNTSGNSLAVLRSALISGNMMDVGNGTLFRATGGVYGTVFNNNTRGLGNGNPFEFVGGNVENIAFTSNYIGGVTGDSTASPYAGILIQDCGTVKGIDVSSNVFADIDGYCLSVQGTGSTVSSLSFSNNACSNIGQDGAGTRAIVRTEFDVNGFIFTGNTAKESAPPTIVRFETGTLTLSNARIFDNVVDTTKTFVNTFVVGANVCMENGNGKFGFNRLPDASATIALNNTISLPVQLTRTGSTGGVGQRYSNDSGRIDIVTTPTGVGSGAHAAATDNLVSLGTGALRWTQLFAATSTINTSDEREKQNISALSDVELRVATTLKSAIKKWQWSRGN